MGEARYERVPRGVEVQDRAHFILVGQAGVGQVRLEHVGRSVGQSNVRAPEHLGRGQSAAQVLAQGLGKLWTERDRIPFSVFAVGRPDGHCQAVQVERSRRQRPALVGPQAGFRAEAIQQTSFSPRHAEPLRALSRRGYQLAEFIGRSRPALPPNVHFGIDRPDGPDRVFRRLPGVDHPSTEHLHRRQVVVRRGRTEAAVSEALEKSFNPARRDVAEDGESATFEDPAQSPGRSVHVVERVFLRPQVRCEVVHKFAQRLGRTDAGPVDDPDGRQAFFQSGRGLFQPGRRRRVRAQAGRTQPGQVRNPTAQLFALPTIRQARESTGDSLMVPDFDCEVLGVGSFLEYAHGVTALLYRRHETRPTA
ncbi:MAG: hypothetical protein QM570_00080 [Planctomycetota bacterium]|nr:hypothetical protein [Planctomycetota bacterium]